MSDSLCKLSANILPQTKKCLDKLKEATGLSDGEIIDRVLVRWQAKDPQIAAQLILDAILIHTNQLEPDDFNKAIFEVLTLLKGSLSDTEPEEIIETIEALEGVIPSTEDTK